MEKINNFRRAKEGDVIFGGGVLTAEGAGQLNAHRQEVAQGNRPTAAELLMTNMKNIPEGKKVIGSLFEQDTVTFPGRVAWTMTQVGAYLNSLTKRR